MTIYSFFEKDCCRPIEKEGHVIYLMRKPDEHLGCILYEDIWIVMDVARLPDNANTMYVYSYYDTYDISIRDIDIQVPVVE